jgi:hypothetical protein
MLAMSSSPVTLSDSKVFAITRPDGIRRHRYVRPKLVSIEYPQKASEIEISASDPLYIEILGAAIPLARS